jgi:hypothetical protein
MKKAPLPDRPTYKAIKSMNKETMQNFLNNIYMQGKQDCNAVEVNFEKLREDISKIKGIGESRLNEIMAVIESYIGEDSE